MPNLNTFFTVASPLTLASLVADVHGLCKGAQPDELRLAAQAEMTLRANVGDDEARRMIADARKGT